MRVALLSLLFFCSGVSGLIYQVIWVREFGNVFGNTVYSTSIVLAIFMLGLGAGSYGVGAWADRRFATAPDSLLKVYGLAELAIAALGLVISLILPSLGSLSAVVSAYTTNASGWNVLSPLSFLGRGLIAFMLLAPITLLMGGTLTLLIRHFVRGNVAASGWTIALLYGVNTFGAAAGALLADFVLIPASGLLVTQLVAVLLNVFAGLGAWYLASQVRLKPDATTARRRQGDARRHVRSVRLEPDRSQPEPAPTIEGVPRSAVYWTSLAIGLAGFAAMGMEILWLRHFNLLLGGFRAVFSLVIAVVLLGIGAGSLVGGLLVRRVAHPAQALMVAQALFVAATLLGIRSASLAAVRESGQAIELGLASLGTWERAFSELWFNVRPMLGELALPAILMGCSFPLANAMIQRAELVVGRRAGLLYLANTLGAVLGSLVAGYVLLPSLGIQGSATMLASAAALAIVPLYLAARASTTGVLVRGVHLSAAVAAVAAAVSLGVWLSQPGDLVLRRSLPDPAEGERVVAISEGVSEVIHVTEVPGRGRSLITNGHPMSSTAPLDQRYMRALAHIPLLSIASPQRVLVIGFGVGNTTHAATLHPSVQQVDVADLSRHVLEHASYFGEANGGVLQNPRVKVFVNDGRQHLQMQPEATYDLVTLEPPPIAYAGVGSLYSREFYALARSRLKPGGYLSQWLPAYQVPAETSLAMVRAFLDVFPETVLLSGTQAELLLVGTTAPALEVEPVRLAERIRAAPEVAADLERLDLGTVTEIIGSFVGSARTLELATRDVPPATDDRPLQEYGVRSTLGAAQRGVPASLFDLGTVDDWCPRCFVDDLSTVPGLDTYLALMYEAYNAPMADVAAAAARDRGRRILGSAYLGAVLPDSAEVYNVLGRSFLRQGRIPEARAAFSEALRRDPESVEAEKSAGVLEYEEGSLLLEQGRFAAAAERFRAALRVMPESAAVHNNLGIALASMGSLAEATEQFRQAVALEPGFAEAQRNLEAALSKRR